MKEPNQKNRRSEEMGANIEVPHSVEAEQGLLGAILIDPGVLDKVGDLVGKNDFYAEAHRHIWHAITKLSDNTATIDALTVYEQLESEGLAERVGGFSYLGKLSAETPSTGAARQYAEVIRDKATRRRIIETAIKLMESARAKDGRSAVEVLDEAESSVLSLSENQNKGKDSFQDGTSVLMRVIERMENLANNPAEDGIVGTPTGFTDLDRTTQGLHGGNLIILAARPAMGKTALALNIAENIATQRNLPVAVFSMEMGADELMQRMAGSLGRIDQTRMRTVRFTDDDWSRMSVAIGKLNQAPIYIDETPSITPFDIRSRVRRLSKKVGPLGLVVVDYLQLLSPGAGTKNDNRAVVVGEFSRSLKLLAKELNTPVLALSQLNRAVEQRPNKRPSMADLRDSGALEQDADLVMFIYRDEIYNPDTEDKGTAEIIIGKHRAGPIGTVRLAFHGQYTRFENLNTTAYGYAD